MKSTKLFAIFIIIFACLMFMSGSCLAAEKTLKVGYSNWPGYVAWEIAIQKGWFKQARVNVEFVWLEYVESMGKFINGELDAVCMTNIDALTLGGIGKHSRAILLTDYSNGADMIIGRRGIRSMKHLKWKRVGVEVGLVGHLLLKTALEQNHMDESQIQIINMPTGKLPSALQSGKVDAIAVWQPVSHYVLNNVAGTFPVFTSKDAPGIIYSGVFVDDISLAKNKAEWAKLVKVWHRIMKYIKDPVNREEALSIMAKRANASPSVYVSIVRDTFLLDRQGNITAFQDHNALSSVYGSSRIADEFNVKNKAYPRIQNVNTFFYPKLIINR